MIKHIVYREESSLNVTHAMRIASKHPRPRLADSPHVLSVAQRKVSPFTTALPAFIGASPHSHVAKESLANIANHIRVDIIGVSAITSGLVKYGYSPGGDVSRYSRRFRGRFIRVLKGENWPNALLGSRSRTRENIVLGCKQSGEVGAVNLWVEMCRFYSYHIIRHIGFGQLGGS